MPTFTARVHVLRPVSGDDEKVVSAMMKAGFGTSVRSSKGIAYALPPGQFVFDGARKLDDVGALAKAASDGLKKAYALTVTETKGRFWHNLPEAEAKVQVVPAPPRIPIAARPIPPKR